MRAYRKLFYRTQDTQETRARRRRQKQALLTLFGGACIRCGYNKNPAALHFDHVIPSDKSFSVSVRSGYSLDKLIEEAQKCVILCANCHAEKTWPMD